MQTLAVVILFFLTVLRADAAEPVTVSAAASLTCALDDRA